MPNGGWRWLSVAVALVAAGLGVVACGSSSSPAAAPPPTTSATPGVVMKILSVTIPSGEGVQPVIRFSVTDGSGNPIDLSTEIPASFASPAGIPNTVPRFTLAQQDSRGNYTSYYASTVAGSTNYTAPDNFPKPTPLPSATQPIFEPPSSAHWPVANLTNLGNGEWQFTMAPINVTSIDRTTTSTAAGWTVRTTASGQDIGPASFNFVPEGNATPTEFQTVTDTACNMCHGMLTAHGTRRGTQLCITCHSPQNTDPDTARTLNFKVMIHKIHSGSSLPSVQQGLGYFIVGFGGSVSDFSNIVFPWNGGVQAACTVCHQGTNADNWEAKPSFTACTSCHDNVMFSPELATTSCTALSSSQSFMNCLHGGGAITVTDPNDPATCTGCHGPGAAIAVRNFHNQNGP